MATSYTRPPDSLFKAIQANNLADVRGILETEKFDLEGQSPDDYLPPEYGTSKYTPLELASLMGHLEIMEVLIVAKANVNNTDNLAKKSPLFCAIFAKKNAAKATQLLLGKNAEPNYLNKEGWSPLTLMAFYDYGPVIESLLNGRALPSFQNERGKTPLEVAADEGHVQAVKILATAESNTKERDLDLWSNDERKSRLEIALEEGNTNMVNTLLLLKVDPNYSPASLPPIYIPVKKGQIEAVESLLVAKANILTDKCGNLLENACYSRNASLVKLLFTVGANRVNQSSVYSSEVNDVLEKAENGEILAKRGEEIEIVITELLLEEAEQLLQLLEKETPSLKYLERRLFLKDRLIRMEGPLEEQKNNVSAEDADQLQKLQELINYVKNIKFELVPSLVIQASAYIFAHGESSLTSDKLASPPLSSSSFTLHAPPQAEAAAQPAEPTAEPVGVAAQSSSSATPERYSIMSQCIVS
jgi:ankyrin repeat protein